VIDPSRVLAALPPALREELLDGYQKIMSNYLERRWEPSELNGGKFCEVVYSIIDGAVKGSFPASAAKPSNMLAAGQALEKQVPIPIALETAACESLSRAYCRCCTRSAIIEVLGMSAATLTRTTWTLKPFRRWQAGQWQNSFASSTVSRPKKRKRPLTP
jgi:hypothetical protein